MGGQWYDANVSLPGCDKNMPGTIIAMARLNRPAIMVYGGTIKPGYSRLNDRPIDIVSAFQSYGESVVLLHRRPFTAHSLASPYRSSCRPSKPCQMRGRAVEALLMRSYLLTSCSIFACHLLG